MQIAGGTLCRLQEALFADSGRLTLSIAGGTLFKSDKAFGRSLINIYGFLPVIAYFMIFI
ncbi:hypothetical protein H3S89_03705 [Bartonella sp. B10834G6]|uniref:hypothetical protein n=1 Tax=Bartonella apis TaxID=1686310 RepID=UPI0018DC6F31|nr:hypothetical protein [Bartonella apis]MBH9981900.1 hypothetical protein [Bartonella apis]